MRGLSLRAKITLWFTAALLLVVCITYITVLSVGDQLLRKTVRDNLIETVEGNFSEIRYHDSLNGLEGSDTSRFLRLGVGFLEIDDDFLNAVNEVYTALYGSDAALLYGENPISAETAVLPFRDSQIQHLKVGGTTYYIFDRKLASKGLDGLWLRGVVSHSQGATQINTVMRVSLFALPVIVLIACIGGYFMVRRMLLPIRRIAQTARRIGTENDLKARIDLGDGRDELHQLADTFNDMFGRLDQAFEAQRRFVSDASHELRTPVSVITAQCELSLEQPRDPKADEEAFRVIRRQSGKLSRLIGDMLDFTRLEAGTEKYPLEPLDLTELVQSVCADLARIGEKGITLRCEAKQGIMMTGNRVLLSRLLTNLIANAYRYGKENGHILVRLAREDDRIRLSVTDDGIGIAKKEQEKIFGRFYQSDPSRSGGGTGLGLSMAAEIARFHGGTLTVSSKPDQGSTFSAFF